MEKQIIDIKNSGTPVIIFGSGSTGEALFHACQEVGIKVDCFCDNDIRKIDKLLCEIKVLHTSDLKDKYQDAIFLISTADIKDIIKQLHELGFNKWYPCGLLLRDFDIHKYKFSFPMDFVEYSVSSCLLCHDSYLNPDKLFLRSVDLIITERCSLKCRDCSNLTQYYKNPKDCDTKELMQSINSFCNIVDEVNEFRIIGAEPLMNQNFDYILISRLITEPKIRKIIIWTNGTIVPDDKKIGLLKNDKVLFMITDYGSLSRNLDALTKKLSSNKIAFYVQKAQGWTDCAKIGRHNRNIEEQREVFRDCCVKNVATISDGKLFRCPFAANAHRLKAVPDYKDDYIDLIQKPNLDVFLTKETINIKEKIKHFLLERDSFETCDFCNGRAFDDPEITPAIQINKPLEYKIYDR